jgi:trichothecene 3-O-acetyltransferase
MAESSFVDDTVLIPGSPFHVDLAPLDARHPVHYSRRLIVFRCISPAQRDAQLAALKAGLQALVVRCPTLGGIVIPPTNAASDSLQDWRTIVSDRGIELIVRDLRSAMSSFEELEAANFPVHKLPYDLLMPIPQDLDDALPFAACKIQFSAVEGGTILTFAMSHSVADGAGTNELMRLLSEQTRLAQEHSDDDVVSEIRSMAVDTVIGQDRSILRDIKSDIAFNIEDHPAYRWKTETPSNEDETPPHPFKATLPETAVLLRLSAAALEQLKADATTPGAPPISTHDALCALIWRTILLIRSRRSAAAQDLPASTIGSLLMPSDARRHLNLPSSYVGNAVYQLAVDIDIGTLQSPSGLRHAASAIRRAISAVSPALVSSYMTELKERWIDWQFMVSASTTGVAMGTDWTSGFLYNEDWGKAFGSVISYRYPGVDGGAMNCIMPKLPDGGAEVILGVMPEEVEVLEGLGGFGKYLEKK